MSGLFIVGPEGAVGGPTDTMGLASLIRWLSSTGVGTKGCGMAAPLSADCEYQDDKAGSSRRAGGGGLGGEEGEDGEHEEASA